MNAAFSAISFLLSVSLQEEISYRTNSPIHFFFHSYLSSSPYTFISISHPTFRWVSFIGYIRNLASIKYNKELEDIMWMSKILIIMSGVAYIKGQFGQIVIINN